MNRQSASRLAVLSLICILATGASHNASGDDSTHSLNDGPHVFWHDDTTTVVFYYCDGSLQQRTFSARDTIRFQGFCRDTAASYAIPTSVPGRSAGEFDDVSRFLAVSDIHGELEPFAEILRAAGVIDGSGHWVFGDGHLVVLGDVFDRGPDVTECLWLIYRLEQEAGRAGGAVHFVLGNHELMVLRGDLRYVHPRYLKGIAGATRLEYDDLFGPETELGRWLRAKPAVLRLGSALFVHGGIAPAYAGARIPTETINEQARRGLDYSSVALRFDDSTRQLYGSTGPFWYRGYLYGIEDRYPEATAAEIDQLLAFYEVDRIIVGHSEQDSIATRYDGRVVAIDVAVEELGGQQALLWEDGRFYRVDRDGRRLEIE